jgi:hypothetical protein
MKKILLLVVCFMCYGCNTNVLFKEYSLYQRDKTINYPKDKLSLKFINDTTGLFINNCLSGESLSQRFIYSRINNNYLVIEKLSLLNSNLISLGKGDTIIVHKNKLFYFYKGNEKYLLSFRRVF